MDEVVDGHDLVRKRAQPHLDALVRLRSTPRRARSRSGSNEACSSRLRTCSTFRLKAAVTPWESS